MTFCFRKAVKYVLRYHVSAASPPKVFFLGGGHKIFFGGGGKIFFLKGVTIFFWGGTQYLLVIGKGFTLYLQGTVTINVSYSEVWIFREKISAILFFCISTCLRRFYAIFAAIFVIFARHG